MQEKRRYWCLRIWWIPLWVGKWCQMEDIWPIWGTTGVSHSAWSRPFSFTYPSLLQHLLRNFHFLAMMPGLGIPWSNKVVLEQKDWWHKIFHSQIGIIYCGTCYFFKFCGYTGEGKIILPPLGYGANESLYKWGRICAGSKRMRSS